MTDDTGTRVFGDVMDALAHPRRRATMAALADREPPVPLDELAAAVVAAEARGPDAGDPTTDGGWVPDAGAARRAGFDDPEREVAVALYHAHLPRLDDAGVVSFDPASKAVDGWHPDDLAADRP